MPGPLFFLCHFNDLPCSVSSQVRLFAGYCLLHRNINSHSDHLNLQKDLDFLQTLAENWGMKFNAAKCYLMCIHSTKQPSVFAYSEQAHLEKSTGQPVSGRSD